MVSPSSPTITSATTPAAASQKTNHHQWLRSPPSTQRNLRLRQINRPNVSP